MEGSGASGAELELAEVLRRLGLGSHAPARVATKRRADLNLDVSGRSVPLEVKARATVTPAQVAALVEAAEGGSVATVVVADRVTQEARAMLREAGLGWLDRRGHLRIVAPGVLIDTDVQLPGSSASSRGNPLKRRAGLAVATWLMSDPNSEALGVRELARTLSLAPSSVSEALADLRAEGMITAAMRPALPELFWEAVDHWQTPRQALASEPRPGVAALTDTLQLGLDAVETEGGWALTDTLAAAAYGAPVGVRSGSPPDFLVPTKQIVRLAAMTLGSASEAARGCTVREAPVGWACQRRIDGRAVGSSTHWPLAHPIFVALDLASDPGRGREVLESWTPPEPWRRVW